jgi:hypothetical protein
MKRIRSWPLYVVLAVFLAYFLFSGDELPKERTEAPAEAMDRAIQSPSWGIDQVPEGSVRQHYQVPTMPPTAYQAYPDMGYPTDSVQPHTYRFRPVEPSKQDQQRYQPPNTLSEWQGTYGAMPGQRRLDPMTQPYPVPGREVETYRFRPLDQTRQSRRWSGNYPNPYTQGDYYTPPQRSAPLGNESLWAESAPKRR